jgi:ABC-type antimicrobial peptide transport system permease subunit
MCEIYKNLNLFFYRCGQIMFIGGLLAFPFGVAYLIFTSIFYDQFELQIDSFLSYIGYMIISIITGFTIGEKYNKTETKN